MQKFGYGFRHELKELIIPISIREFHALVEKAKVVESLNNSSKISQSQAGRLIKSKFKQNDNKKPYFKPQFSKSRGSNSQSPANVRWTTYC